MYTAPELKRYSNILPSNENRSKIDITKAEIWTLGCLLYELHFQEKLDFRDIKGCLRASMRDGGIP